MVLVNLPPFILMRDPRGRGSPIKINRGKFTPIRFLSYECDKYKKMYTPVCYWAVQAVFILSKWCHATSCFAPDGRPFRPVSGPFLMAPLRNLVLTDDLSPTMCALHRSEISCWQTGCLHVHLLERCFAPLNNRYTFSFVPTSIRAINGGSRRR